MVIATIICNATPLINFAAINRLDILQTTLGPIIIPQAVYDETNVINFPGLESVRQAVTTGWLKVRQVSAVGNNIPVVLDNREREAIALVLELKTQQILLDEHLATNKSMGKCVKLSGVSAVRG